MDKQEIFELFQQSGAVLKGHFLLTSGRHSDTYMQCAKLFVEPALSEKLCEALASKLKNYNPEYVVSPAVGGIIMGYEMARQLGAKNIFTERVDGKMELRRGFEIPKGAKAIVVEDVVTTGGSSKEVVELLKSMEVEVLAVASMVDRSNGTVDFGIDFAALLSMDIKSYEKDECPICAAKNLPLVKPGSRALKV